LTLQLTPYFEPRAGWQRRSTRQILVEPAVSLIAAKIQPDSAAAQAGLQPGDVIRAADGQRLYSTYGLLEAEATHAGGPVRLEVQRAGQTLEKTLQAPAYLKVGAVLEGSPAAQAGLKAGDEIVALNGEKLTRSAEFSERVKAGGEKPLRLTLRRGGETLEKTLTPQRPENRPKADLMIGIAWNFNTDGIIWDDGGLSHFAHPSPVEQLSGSVTTIGNTLGALLSPKSDIGLGLLSGPVGIGHGYYNLLTSEQGWRLALWFSVVLNVNLALMNLLPIPILDGGHITLAIVEAIRRKPVNLRVLEIIQTGCFVLIVGVALYITFFDVGDFAEGGRSRLKFRQQQQQTQPAAAASTTAKP
ncbi:MAG: site-2 protease family protein, partial [Verrucomicrobia bacterium]|nr:site-2 protease family protein [Verrucomicrobiota bacterium]